MSRFVEGEDRRQPVLLPSCLDDYVGEENPARVIDVFVDELDLRGLGFEIVPAMIRGKVLARPRRSVADLILPSGKISQFLSGV